MTFWNRVKDSHDPAMLKANLDQFPNGISEGHAGQGSCTISSRSPRSDGAVLSTRSQHKADNRPPTPGQKLKAERIPWFIINCLVIAGPMLLSPAHADDQSICSKSNSPDEIIKACSRVIEQNSSDTAALAAAYQARGKAYGNKEDNARAIADLNKAIELAPNSANAYYARGFHEMFERNYRSALSDYNKAIKLNPAHPDAHFARAEVCLLLNDRECAISSYRRALWFNPELKRAQETLETLLPPYENVSGKIFFSCKGRSIKTQNFNDFILVIDADNKRARFADWKANEWERIAVEGHHVYFEYGYDPDLMWFLSLNLQTGMGNIYEGDDWVGPVESAAAVDCTQR